MSIQWSGHEWPCSVVDLIAGLDYDQPIAELFNVIYMTMCKTWKRSVALNEHEFLSTSDDIVGVLSGLMKEISTHSSLDNNDQCHADMATFTHRRFFNNIRYQTKPQTSLIESNKVLNTDSLDLIDFKNQQIRNQNLSI